MMKNEKQIRRLVEYYKSILGNKTSREEVVGARIFALEWVLEE